MTLVRCAGVVLVASLQVSLYLWVVDEERRSIGHSRERDYCRSGRQNDWRYKKYSQNLDVNIGPRSSTISKGRELVVLREMTRTPRLSESTTGLQ